MRRAGPRHLSPGSAPRASRRELCLEATCQSVRLRPGRYLVSYSTFDALLVGSDVQGEPGPSPSPRPPGGAEWDASGFGVRWCTPSHLAPVEECYCS